MDTSKKTTNVESIVLANSRVASVSLAPPTPPVEPAPETVPLGGDARNASMDQIRGYEGVREWAYKDSNDKWHTGVGHLIGNGSEAALDASPYADLERRSTGKLDAPVEQQGRRLDTAEIDKLYSVDYDTHEERAKKITPNYDSYSDRLKAEIVQATYRGG